MFGQNRRFSVTGGKLSSSPSPVPRKITVSKAKREEAFIGNEMSMGGLGWGGNTPMNFNVSGPMSTVTMMSGLVMQQEEHLRRYYRDIYFYDAVGGSAVDMVASFPYSDFSLTGLEPERIEKYQESMVRLNIRQLMPEITRTMLVDGVYCGSLLFNNRDKVFIDVINYSIDDCQLEHMPFFGCDPVVTVKSNEQLRNFAQSSSRQAQMFRNLLPPNVIEVLGKSAFELDPLTCLYVARRTLPGQEPISWLKRLLPAYFVEKTLFRGTLVEVMRRQRAMLHIMMGDDTHEFTPDEMAETVSQFQMADLDPLGAVVGTRNNVQVQEVRQGGDFWKWTDNIEQMVPYKLRALGISEAFLSGDSNYSNVETGMSVFMENMDAGRNDATHQVLTNKIFPLVAVANGFYKEGKERNINNKTSLHHQLENNADLDIPVVRWHKQLEARAEENMMETLATLEEKGFPIPLRMWAAAAKIDINSLYEDLREDEKIKKKIEKLTGKKVNINPDQGTGGGSGGGDGDDDWGSEFAGLRAAGATRPGVRRVPLLAREFNDGEIRAQTKTGRDKWVYNQKKESAKLNQLIRKAVVELSNNPNSRKNALARVRQKNGGKIPNILK